MSDVSSVTSHWPSAHEGFVTTLGSSILSGATTVPLTTVSGLTNGNIFVGIIEPGQTKQQTFTGVIDTGGSQITGVKWTRGTNADHAAGVTIVDYVSGTGQNMMTKGLLVAHDQDGTHKASLALTTPKITTSINDANGNEVIKTPATASAVNEITVTNAATGSGPTVSATGGDTNIDLNFASKGTGKLKGIVDNLYNPCKFSVYRNAALNSSNTPARVDFDTKTYDTSSNVDVVTNKGRFTVVIPGNYTFLAQAGNTAATSTSMYCMLYKNGSLFRTGSVVATTIANIRVSVVAFNVPLVATDYIEVYFVGGSGSTMAVGATECYFEGFLASAS